jgi:hypothetical protein
LLIFTSRRSWLVALAGMTKHLLSFLLLLWFTGFPVVRGQQLFDFRTRTDVSVLHNGSALRNPWTGGWNSPQFSKIDLNRDGVEDLFVFDRSHYKASTFLAVQTNGQWGYVYAPEYEAIFPKMEFWALLRDYNCDGLPDIFTRTNLGLRVYRQVLSPQGQVGFVLDQELVTFNNGANLLAGGVEDLPSITDMDGDGDLDILVYEWSSGITIEYFRNQQVEQGLPCGQLKYSLDTPFWGRIGRCAGNCNEYLFGSVCRLSKPLHVGGSSLLAIDLTGNGVKDVLMGHEDCPDLVSMINTGTATNASFSSHQKNIPGQIPAGTIGPFPAAYFEDVTFDGIKDLIVAPNALSNVHEDVNMSQSVWVYPNLGTNQLPAFSSSRSPFMQNGMLDVGEGSAPAFADLDGDGLPDMLVGNYADVRNGTYRSTLSYYRNTGTRAQPTFTLVTNDYLGLSALNLLNLRPHLTDFNGNGAVDLVFSSTNPANLFGQIRYILNGALAGQPVNFSAASVQELQGLEQNADDMPFFFDIDGDGRQDLLMGTSNGGLRYYRNSGTATVPVWTLVTNTFGGIGPNFNRRLLYPLVTDLNRDGKPDLVTADNSGVLRIYPDFRSHMGGAFPAPNTQVFYQPLLQSYGEGRLGRRLALAAADLTGNNYPELVVGSQAGGLLLFYQHGVPLSIPREEPPTLLQKWRLFPNPATETVLIESPEEVQVTVFDASGRLVFRSAGPFRSRHQVPVEGMRPGLYLVRITNAAGRAAGKSLVIQR